MNQKKLMLLGGIRYLLPVIKSAHNLGYYVITVDNVPDNIAHHFSDEYINVDITDPSAVLVAATRANIDGIMSFGVDPGVISASYVQNRLGLPSCGPYESVVILQNKDKFRSFLKQHHFNVPESKGYDNINQAIIESASFNWPVIVKPVDSAGSKGVTRVNNAELLRPAIEQALTFSRSNRFIVEEFIEKDKFSSDSECFSINGNLVIATFSSQRFDENSHNPYVPAAFSWPSSFTESQETYLKKEIQRLITLLNMKTSIYNVETRVGLNGVPYIMEVSPRGGGNRLAEMIKYATGMDMIGACVRAAVGETIDIHQQEYKGNWAEIVIHSNKKGKFKQLLVKDDILNGKVIERDLWTNQGNNVDEFIGANQSLGTLVLNFDSESKMKWALDNQDKWMSVEVE